MRYHFLSCLWLHSWPWQTTKHTQRRNRQSPKAISTLHWHLSPTTTRLPSQTISICQITVLPDDSPIKETLQKVPQTIWDHCSAESAILHTSPSRYYEGHPSYIPCLYAWTSHTQHLPAVLQTSASTCNHRRRTRIWDLQDSQLQDWLPEGMQTTIQGYMARIQRYRQQLQIVTSNRTGTCQRVTK